MRDGDCFHQPSPRACGVWREPTACVSCLILSPCPYRPNRGPGRVPLRRRVAVHSAAGSSDASRLPVCRPAILPIARPLPPLGRCPQQLLHPPPSAALACTPACAVRQRWRLLVKDGARLVVGVCAAPRARESRFARYDVLAHRLLERCTGRFINKAAEWRALKRLEVQQSHTRGQPAHRLSHLGVDHATRQPQRAGVATALTGRTGRTSLLLALLPLPPHD
eukprot:1675332-Prymnesium_polylepis.1